MSLERKVRVINLIAITETCYKELANKYGEIEKRLVSVTSYYDFDGKFITSVQEEEKSL